MNHARQPMLGLPTAIPAHIISTKLGGQGITFQQICLTIGH